MFMMNCWDIKGCGFGPDADKTKGGRVCPAASHTSADGFLGGVNGGRACHFIMGTFCGGKGPLPQEEKLEGCKKCSFYQSLRDKHGNCFSKPNFVRFVTNSENRFLY